MSRGPHWTAIEHKRLRYLREVLKLPWSQISLPGRTSKACEGEYYARRFASLREKPAKPPPRPKRQAAPAPIIAEPVIIRAAAPERRADLDRLRERAELRDRIIERGLTGGVFGDPRPGRSALDRRAAATTLATVPSSHVEPTSSSRDGRDVPGHARFPTFAQVTT